MAHRFSTYSSCLIWGNSAVSCEKGAIHSVIKENKTKNFIITESLGKSNLQRAWSYNKSTWTVWSVRWSLPIKYNPWKKEAWTSIAMEEEAAKNNGVMSESLSPVAMVKKFLIHNASACKHCYYWDSTYVLALEVKCNSCNKRIFCNAEDIIRKEQLPIVKWMLSSVKLALILEAPPVSLNKSISETVCVNKAEYPTYAINCSASTSNAELLPQRGVSLWYQVSCFFFFFFNGLNYVYFL